MYHDEDKDVYKNFSKLNQVTKAFQNSTLRDNQHNYGSLGKISREDNFSVYKNVPAIPPKRPPYSKPVGGYQKPEPWNDRNKQGQMPSKDAANPWMRLRSNTLGSRDLIIDEFKEGVVIVENLENVENALNAQAKGTYLIHKGPHNTRSNPYTIYANQISKKSGKLQALPCDINYDEEKNVFFAEPTFKHGGYHTSLRALVDQNRKTLKYEHYQRYYRY